MIREDDWEVDTHILAVVKKELDRLQGIIEFEDPYSEDKYVAWTKRVEPEKYPEGCARLRLDFELAENADDNEKALKLMFDLVAIDLSDLLENGDTDDHADPLLGAYNGSRKRGKQLDSISIPSSVIYREYKPLKKTYEYTMYLLVTAEWS